MEKETEKMEEMEKERKLGPDEGPWRSFDGEKESIDMCIRPKAPVWSD